jgi:hypothetical protein
LIGYDSEKHNPVNRIRTKLKDLMTDKPEMILSPAHPIRQQV